MTQIDCDRFDCKYAMFVELDESETGIICSKDSIQLSRGFDCLSYEKI